MAEELVQLHIWLRSMFSPEDSSLTLVKGFAYAQSLRPPLPWKVQQVRALCHKCNASGHAARAC